MEQSPLEAALSQLEEKIKKLLEERQALRQELLYLRKDNTELRAAVEKKAEQVNNFQNQIKISKIVDSMAVEEDTAGLKDKINEYIKDIDKCITLLSS